MNDSAAVNIPVLNEHQPMYMAQVRRSLARNSVLAVHPKPTYTTPTNTSKLTKLTPSYAIQRVCGFTTGR